MLLQEQTIKQHIVPRVAMVVVLSWWTEAAYSAPSGNGGGLPSRWPSTWYCASALLEEQTIKQHIMPRAAMVVVSLHDDQDPGTAPVRSFESRQHSSR